MKTTPELSLYIYRMQGSLPNLHWTWVGLFALSRAEADERFCNRYQLQSLPAHTDWFCELWIDPARSMGVPLPVRACFDKAIQVADGVAWTINLDL